MAELGIAASVLGLATAGCQLSSRLNALCCDIVSAGVEIPSVSKGVMMFSLILKQVGLALQAADSVHSSEALETAKLIADECKRVFDEIEGKMDKSTTKRADGSMAPSIQQRFKWAFKKDRVQILLARLESLKLDLLVMFQILQMGKLMAATSNSAPKEEIAVKHDMIAQERAETRNLVIFRYLHMNRLDDLYTMAEYEEAEEENKQIEQGANGGSDSTQLTIKATPVHGSSSALIKLPVVSLGEPDTTLSQIKESPKDIPRISESVIDPLLNRWTRWQEFHDRLETRPPSRYSSTVQNLYESHDSRPRYQDDFHDRGESPQDYYLEGTTTDWRKPHSPATKEQAARLKKEYAELQPFISAESGDVENNHLYQSPKKRAPSRHLIDSSSETSDSEPELLRQRRRSYIETANDSRSRYPPQRPSPSRSFINGGENRASFNGRSSSSPNSHPNSTTRSSVSVPRPPGVQRPVINPVQDQYQHAYNSPPLPLYTSNAPDLYTPQNQYSPTSNTSLQPPSYQNYSQPQHYPQQYPPRYVAPQGYRMAVPPQPQPGYQDGKAARSSSRYSNQTMHRQRSVEDLKKADRSERKKNLARGAVGGGAISGIMEALDGLDF